MACLWAFTVSATPADRLVESAQALDESVQKGDLGNVLPDLAKLLKTETGVVEKALFYQNLKLSDIVLARFAAEKNKIPMDSLLKGTIDWPKVLDEKKLNLSDAREYLDDMASEVAFIVFEHKHAGKK